MTTSIIKLNLLTILFFIGSSFAYQLHTCFPIEYILNEDASAMIVCSSEKEFFIPTHVNSPDILRKVIKANKDKSHTLYVKTYKDKNTVINIEIKKIPSHFKK